MSLAKPIEYECVRCGLTEVLDDTLHTICPRCGGEMRNVELIDR